MKYNFTDKFIVRQPLLPTKDNYSKEEAIELFKTSPIIREALYLASPDLYRELDKSISNNESIDPKLFTTLYKYLNRMTFRSTPFGLFGNCGVGTWGESNQVTGNPQLYRKSRLDMSYLCGLYTYLVNKKEVHEEVLLYLNTSLYVLGDTFRYLEHTSEENNRSYQISEVPVSDELEAIVKKAQNGEKFVNMVHLLMSLGHSDEDSESFVRDCIQSQILVAGFEPNVTGEDNLTGILDILSTVQSEEIQHICGILKEVQQDIGLLDDGLNTEEDYQRIIAKLRQIEGVPVNEKFVFQVDSFRDNRSFSLDHNKQKDILDAAEVLALLTPQHSTGNANLAKFKSSFYDRYEDSFVSLVEVIDAEFGLGYPVSNKSGFSDLATGIELSKSKRKNTSRSVRVDQYTELLYKYIVAAEKNQQHEFTMTKEQLQQQGFTYQEDRLPLSMSALVRSLPEGKINLEGLAGPSAINILSRFGHGEPKIKDVIGEIVEKEDQLCDDIILAEILHLPEGRIGNVILHPKYRKHEMPFLAGLVNSEYTISITDLEIGLRANMVVLRSKKLNKIIIPRLSNAHAYTSNSLPLYHFLCDIQTQFSSRALFFEWPEFTHKPFFYPRLTVGDVIISPAMWNINVSALINLSKGIENDKELKALGLPRKVVFAEGDNTLVIDLEDKNSVISLVESCKKEKVVLLKEYQQVSEAFAENGDCFSHELVLPLVRTEPNNDVNMLKSMLPLTNQTEEIQKSFLPGSEWAYFKLYGGKQGIERILAYELRGLLDELEKEQLIESWFFIRYEDPDYHLRLRFKLNDTQQLGRLLTLTHSYLHVWAENKLIYKTTMDTYNREIERYLFSAIPNIEYLFYRDSESIVSYLNEINEKSDRLRWLFALKSIDFLLSDFGLTADDKIKFLDQPTAYFKKEFNADKPLLQKINKKFKSHREEIHEYMSSDIQSDIILTNRSVHCKVYVQNILDLYGAENIDKSLHALIADFTHMLINRLFHFNPRFHEMIIYEVLTSYYKYVKHVGKASLSRQKTTG